MLETMPEHLKAQFIAPEVIREEMDKLYDAQGWIRMTPISPQALRELMRSDGVREEDNLFSCGIIAARDGGQE